MQQQDIADLHNVQVRAAQQAEQAPLEVRILPGEPYQVLLLGFNISASAVRRYLRAGPEGINTGVPMEGEACAASMHGTFRFFAGRSPLTQLSWKKILKASMATRTCS